MIIAHTGSSGICRTFNRFCMNTLVQCNAGIDVSKADFKVAISALDGNRSTKPLGLRAFDNNSKGFDAFFKWCRSITGDNPCGFTLEYTGIYSEALMYYLDSKQCSVCMVSPYKSKRFRESYDADIKTDDHDAQILSLMGLERKLPLWKPASPFFTQLRQLVRERFILVKQKTALANRLHALSYAHLENATTKERLKTQKKFFSKQIRDVEKQIAASLQSDADVWHRVCNVLTMPGIGLTTVACLLAETDGFAKTSSAKKLVAFAGYKVTIKESGQWKGKSHISKRGNKFIRHALHMPVLSVIQCNPLLAGKYQALRARKAKPIIATTAMERKSLIIIYALYKNDIPFDANIKKAKL